jgi:cytochrome bd-type quinol oxidase subunit 1
MWINKVVHYCIMREAGRKFWALRGTPTDSNSNRTYEEQLIVFNVVYLLI